jgi:hypothetical protein
LWVVARGRTEDHGLVRVQVLGVVGADVYTWLLLQGELLRLFISVTVPPLEEIAP